MPHDITAGGPAEPIGPHDERYVPATVDNGQLRAPGPALSSSQTIKFGQALVDAFRDDADFRWKYYTLSRTWHEKAVNHRKGGEYGNQWCPLLENKLGIPSVLLNDFGNLHAYAFFSMRRSLIAMTSHDVDPGAPNHPGPVIDSFHWPPNDGSSVTYQLTDLGLDPAHV